MVDAFQMSKLGRRRIAAGVLIAAGLLAISIPFLFHAPTQSGPGPTPTSNNGNNGSNPPPCTSNCNPPPCTANCNPPPCSENCNPVTDHQPPVTTASIVGEFSWNRQNIPYFYPNFTVTLHATDDGNLSSIVLNDTGTVTTFHVHGNSTTVELTVTMMGLHVVWYYSTDQAGNREVAHKKIAGLAKPNVSDLQNLIANSSIDHGVKNALLAKVESAGDQLSAGRNPNGLTALTNQINALTGKHGLDQNLASQLLSIIAIIRA